MSNKEGMSLLNAIKKFLLYFIFIDNKNISHCEDFDKEEEIFYYQYIMKL